MSRSLNKVELIGNLTRDPELRYTPQGTAVCTFGLATNRQWTTDAGEKKEEVEFHRIVAWSKLAELCSQLLSKGRKVYVEGRLQTRKWTGQDGVERITTEIVISDMIILDSKGAPVERQEFDIPEDLDQAVPTAEEAISPKDQPAASPKAASQKSTQKSDTKIKKDETKDDKSDAADEKDEGDDIPF
jgi:single-strand DNA-binding protein